MKQKNLLQDLKAYLTVSLKMKRISLSIEIHCLKQQQIIWVSLQVLLLNKYTMLRVFWIIPLMLLRMVHCRVMVFGRLLSYRLSQKTRLLSREQKIISLSRKKNVIKTLLLKSVRKQQICLMRKKKRNVKSNVKNIKKNFKKLMRIIKIRLMTL